MDYGKLAEKLKDAILGDLKRELREFKKEVLGLLEGFKIAIETMNKRMDSLERRMDSLDETDNRGHMCSHSLVV